jgi:hypothetical protein
MINHATSRESKEERNKVAKAIISIMGNMHEILAAEFEFSIEIKNIICSMVHNYLEIFWKM